MFKKDDKVLCISGADDLFQGAVYTIAEYDDSISKVILQESRYVWFSSRFILLTALTEALI